jgi:hypothetical protein
MKISGQSQKYQHWVVVLGSCIFSACTIGPSGFRSQPTIITLSPPPLGDGDTLLLDVRGEMSTEELRDVAASATSAIYKAKIKKDVIDLHLLPEARGTTILSIKVHDIGSYPVAMPFMGMVRLHSAIATIRILDFETRDILSQVNINSTDVECMLGASGVQFERKGSQPFGPKPFGLVIVGFLQGLPMNDRQQFHRMNHSCGGVF